MFSHKGAAISMDRMTHEGGEWPFALRAEAFAPLRTQYESVIERILEVPDGEQVPNELIEEARTVLHDMYDQVGKADLEGPDAARAIQHLKAQAGMVAMLKQPDVKKVLDEATNLEAIELPNLLDFMRAFNLQVAAAHSPEEEELYAEQLYPMMAEVRDSIDRQYKDAAQRTKANRRMRRPGRDRR